MGLLGNLTGLFGLLLIKKYTFTWQSTLLDNDHLITLLTAISYLPSLLLSTVITMPAIDEHIISHSRILGLLALTSLVVYGMIPRALTLAYTTYCSKYTIKLDETLYYYENLLHMFRHSIIDSDDHQPATPKPIVMTVDKVTTHKLIATFENAYNPFWYQYKADNDITDVGTIDTKADFVRLQTAIKHHKATVYLGINTAILPDRGVIRKLKQI